MAKHKKIDAPLPRGPWLSEEEIQAILSTDDSGEFDRLMARKSHTTAARRLWWPVAAVAASVVAAAFIMWPRQAPVEPESEAVAYIYGNRVENEQAALDMMHATLAEALTPPTSLENELTNILTP